MATDTAYIFPFDNLPEPNVQFTRFSQKEVEASFQARYYTHEEAINRARDFLSLARFIEQENIAQAKARDEEKAKTIQTLKSLQSNDLPWDISISLKDVIAHVEDYL